MLISASNNVTFAGSSAGDPSNVIKMTGKNASIGFKSSESATIPKLELTSIGRLRVNANQQITVGSVPQTFVVEDVAATGGAVTIRKPEDNARILMRGQSSVKILSAGTGCRYCVDEALKCVALTVDLSDFTGENIPLFDVPDNDVTLNVLGDRPVAFLEHGAHAEVTKQSLQVAAGQSATVSVGSGMRLKVDGTVNVTDGDGRSWRNKVMNWFDASDAATRCVYDVNGLQNVTTTGGYPLIKGWTDKLTGTNGVYLFNVRSYTDAKVNDRYMGTYGPNATDARRIEMRAGTFDPDGHHTWETSISPVYAIFVFGSQFGGGAAVLGTKDRAFYRRDAEKGIISRDAKPMTGDPFVHASDCAFRVDGTSVDATQAHPDGGWQIVSIDLSSSSSPITSLGQGGNNQDSGGQNYAELIFFRENPTAKEVYACEQYLARKWGLEAKYGGQYSCLLRTEGDGTLVLDANATLEGGFTGTINVREGKTLTISAGQPIPTEETFESDGRIVWFDPPTAGAITYLNNTKKVAYLAGRDNAGVLDPATHYNLWGNGREPAVVEKELVDGRTLNWIDFTNNQVGVVANYQNNGKTLRTRVDLSKTATALTNVCTAFIVMDSSRGGGSVMNTDVFYSGIPGARASNGVDFTKPIWMKREGAFADVTTYLDNHRIGVTDGFTGKPEILSVTFNSMSYNSGFFAYFSGHGCEIMGEMMFYSKILSEEQRALINAYLMKKWLGRYDANGNGLCDLSGATVTGAGTVVVSAGAKLPQLSDAFTGTVQLQVTTYAFTIDSSVSTDRAVDAVQINGAVTLPNACEITVAPGTRVAPGTYALLSSDALTGGETLTLRTTGDFNWAKYTPRLERNGQSVALRLSPDVFTACAWVMPRVGGPKEYRTILRSGNRLKNDANDFKFGLFGGVPEFAFKHNGAWRGIRGPARIWP